MADNILKAVLQFEAKGVVQASTQVNTALVKTEQGLKKVGASSNQATNALTSLGRVVQDAPFGFIAISNNINPLLESFQRLKQETGSTSGALKAFGAGLLGAGGLGLAVSAVTSLLVVFSGGMSRAKKETEETTKATDDAKKKQDEFAQAVSSASSFIIGQAKDINDLRDALTSTAKGFDDLTAATIRQGVARLIFSEKENAIQKALSAEIERQFILRSRLKGINAAPEFKVDRELDGLEKIYQAELKLGRNDTSLKTSIDRIRELNSVIGESGGVVRFLNSISQDLQKMISGFIKVDKVKVKLDNVEVEPFIARTDLITVVPKDLSFDTSQLRLQPSKFLQIFQEENQSKLDKLRENLLDLAKTGEFVGNKIADGFDNVFNALANGQDPIKALGEAVKNLVVDLIQAAIRAFIVKSIINLFAPGVGSASSFALSGLRLPGRASGGPVQAGRSFLVGENGPEIFTPGLNGSIIPNGRLNNFSSGLGEVVFRIQGNQLVGVLSNATAQQGRLAGR